MPEGDSLVRVAHRLRPVLEGRVLTHADLRVPRHATADLTGWTVAEVLPRAKYLLMRLTPPAARPGARPLTLISHLKMEGRWLVSAVDARWGAPAWQVRAVLETAEHRVLGAQLGLLTLVPTADEATVLGHLGPDLLDPAWDTPDDGAALLAEGVRRLTARPERPVGLALLDQRLVSGIGNIYRCETLLLAGIDPHRHELEADAARRPAQRLDGRRLVGKGLLVVEQDVAVADRDHVVVEHALVDHVRILRREHGAGRVQAVQAGHRR